MKRLFLITVLALVLLGGCAAFDDQAKSDDGRSARSIKDSDEGAGGGRDEITSDREEEAVIRLQEEENEPVIKLLPEAEESEKSDEGEAPEEDAEAFGEDAPKEDDFHGYVLSEEEKADPRVRCVETREEGRVVMDFAGDINFDEHYSNMSSYKAHGSTMSGVMSANLLEELNGADIFTINNEFPYSERGTPTQGKKYTFRARPSMVKNLLEMGVDLASLANNHAYDHGSEALMDTFDTLDEALIPYVGAGRNLEEAMKPYYFIAGGMKIAYVAATQIERTYPPDTKEATEDSPGVLRTLEPERFLGVIEEADRNADLTVVFVHWGSENTYEVEAGQRELASGYASAGADLIVGAHSHCLQGFEYVQGVPVLYSLGNFWFSSKDRDSGVLQAVASEGRIESVRFIPCIQHNCRTDMYEKGDAEYSRILAAMAGISMDVSIDEEGYVTAGAGRGVAPGQTKPL